MSLLSKMFKGSGKKPCACSKGLDEQIAKAKAEVESSKECNKEKSVSKCGCQGKK